MRPCETRVGVENLHKIFSHMASHAFVKELLKTCFGFVWQCLEETTGLKIVQLQNQSVFRYCPPLTLGEASRKSKCLIKGGKPGSVGAIEV